MGYISILFLLPLLRWMWVPLLIVAVASLVMRQVSAHRARRDAQRFSRTQGRERTGDVIEVDYHVLPEDVSDGPPPKDHT